MKRAALILTLVASILGTSFLVACSPAATTPPTAAAEVKTLNVGCTLPFDNSLGMDTKKALEMIVPAFNAAGGLTVQGQKYNINMIIYDDKYTADGGRAAVERLVNEDKVKFIICQVGSAPIVAGLAVTEPAKVMVLCGGASSKIIDPANKYTFGTATWRTNLAPLFPLLKTAFPNAKTMVNLSPDDETGKALASDNAKIATALGFTVLDNVFYPRDTQDFAPFATKIAAEKPDIMDFPGAVAGTQFGLQFKALYEAGFTGAQVSPMPPSMTEVLAVTPPESMEGLISILPSTEIPQPTALATQYKQDWTAKYGQWSTVSLTWIPAFYAFVNAVQKADSVDPEVVSAYLSANGLSWQSPNGSAMLVKRPDFKNDRFCDTCASLDFGIFKKGAYQYLGTISADDALKANQSAFGGVWQ
ncbi:MAG: ABC transporter substrate-binding protein [Dehalococcoidia bacterium]|jgi:branched-chain amino acid transport system substrate-binding protein